MAIGAYCKTRDCYVLVENEATLQRIILLDNLGARDDDSASGSDNEYGWEAVEHGYACDVIEYDEVGECFDEDIAAYAADANEWRDIAQSIHEIIAVFGWFNEDGTGYKKNEY